MVNLSVLLYLGEPAEIQSTGFERLMISLHLECSANIRCCGHKRNSRVGSKRQ